MRKYKSKVRFAESSFGQKVQLTFPIAQSDCVPFPMALLFAIEQN